MNTQRTIKSTLISAAVGLLLFLGACSKDDKQDDVTVIGTGGSTAGANSKGGNVGNGGLTGGGAGRAGTGGKAQGGSSTTTGGAPDIEGGANNGTGGTGPDAGGQPAEGGAPTSECFVRPKTTADNLQFLNRCTDSRCSPFDNYQRIPGFTGTLPPL